MKGVTRKLVPFQALALLGLAAAPAFAQTPPAPPADSNEPPQHLNFTMAAGGTWSDNIARLAVGEDDGTIGVAGVALDYAQHSRRFETDVDLNAAYQHFFDGEFDDEVIGGVDANLEIGIVPERFTWGFSENFGQIDFDPFSVSTPDNRENVNIFGTSPRLMFKLGDFADMTISAHYTQSEYERSAIDGSDAGGGLTLTRALSGRSHIAFSANATRYEFDDPQANTNYDFAEALVSYALEGSRTRLSADLGYNAVKIDESEGGLLMRLSIAREMSPGAELTLGAGREISNAGDVFRLGQGAAGVQLDTENVVGTSDPFERTYASIGYHFTRHRTSLGIDVEATQERYETQTELDRDLVSYNVFVTRQLSAVLSLRVFASLEDEEYGDVAFNDDETNVGAHLDWQLGQRLALRLRYDHFDRDSSTPSAEFSEDQASLFMLWSPIRQR